MAPLLNETVVNSNPGINVICCAQARIKNNFSCERARFLRTRLIHANEKVQTKLLGTEKMHLLYANAHQNQVFERIILIPATEFVLRANEMYRCEQL